MPPKELVNSSSTATNTSSDWHRTLHDDQLQRLSRLFLIYNTLEMGNPVNRNDLAAACNCTTKTIQRDLQFLREAGADCQWDVKKRSYVLAAPLHSLTVKLTLPELLALALWQEALPQATGLPQEAAARSAFAKLSSHLPVALRDELEEIGSVLNVEAGTRRNYQQAPLPELVQAARQGESLDMTYYTIKRDTVSRRRVDPYNLALQQGYFALVAYCHERQAMLLFALDNIRSLQATGEHFERQRDFSLAAFLKGSMGLMRGEPVQIVVRFDASIARWAARYRWSFSPTLEPQTDGTLILRGTVSGLEGIRTELLRWGSPVTVLEPPELREALLKEAQAIVKKYQKLR